MVTDPQDVTRFNEAIDQLIAESVTRYSGMIKKSQKMFLAILGHDLRNPLGTIIAASNLILETKPADSFDTTVASCIYRSGRRMGMLVENLLDFTRTRFGSSLPIAPNSMNIGVTVAAVVDELRTSHPSHTIDVEIDGKLDGCLDESRMAQVFSNLIGNALQHGSKAEPVKVRLAADDDRIIATIWNSGTPVPPEKIGSIFDPLVSFSEDGKGERSTGRSLGLGLYIAHEIVHAHKGSITVSSTAESGTMFTLAIPVAPDYDDKKPSA